MKTCASGGASVFLHVWVAQPFADVAPNALGLAARHRIGAIIGGIEGARPVIAREAHTAERRVRRSAVCWAVPIDHSSADVRPELVVHFRGAPDQTRREAEAGIVRFGDGGAEVLDADNLQ